MQITSLQNPRVKAAARLRNSRDRTGQRRIIIDGIREIHRALESGVQLREVFVSDELADSAAVRELLSRLTRPEIERFEVTAAVFAKLAYGDRAEGVVAVAEMPRRTLAECSPLAPREEFRLAERDVYTTLPRDPLVAVLEGVEKPGNIGAVLRSADGAGVSAVIVADGGADLYNPNAIRASLGTIFSLPVVAATSDETLAWLRQNKLTIFAARVDGAADYTSCDFTKPCAIVLGSESQGLSKNWHGEDITSIRLPMLGAADSLNVSATAAVLFYEALRQRACDPLPGEE